MVTIKVPKPAKGSFDKNRPVSELIKHQLRHWHEVEKHLPHHHRTARNIEEIKTEGEASEYLKRVTARVHIQGKVKVPRPAPGSFHKHRPISDLLKTQIEHFHEVEMTWPEGKRTGTDCHSIKTELEAAAYLKKMTAIMHGNVQPTPPAKVQQTPLAKVQPTPPANVRPTPTAKQGAPPPKAGKARKSSGKAKGRSSTSKG